MTGRKGVLHERKDRPDVRLAMKILEAEGPQRNDIYYWADLRKLATEVVERDSTAWELKQRRNG